MQKLSKADRKLVGKGRSDAGRAMRAKDKTQRMFAVPVAIAVSRAEAYAGAMIPTVTLPVLGAQKVSTLFAYGLAAHYMFARTHTTITTTAGLTALGLVCRAQ